MKMIYLIQVDGLWVGFSGLGSFEDAKVYQGDPSKQVAKYEGSDVKIFEISFTTEIIREVKLQKLLS
jgi:hypothetical protein